MTFLRLGVSVPVLILLLVGCGDEEVAVKDPVVRAIKSYEIAEPATGDKRDYSGTLVASNTSALGFAVSGTVRTVDVSAGDNVLKGQVLASLDTEPFELSVSAARAQLADAEATFTEMQAAVERQRQLFQKGWVAKAALDQATSAFNGARAQLDLARSKLGIAERDLKNASLLAPFDGRIADRDIEPFQEVQAGQAILRIDSDGALEVTFSVADSVVSRLNAGASVTVDIPSSTGCGCSARITEIGTTTSTANTITVQAAMIDGTKDLLPGMAANVRVPLGGASEDAGYLVPITAIAPGDESARGYLFVFNRESGTVQKTPISGGSSVSGNLVAVRGSLRAGDIVAAAGTSFLREGQRVKLLGE